MKSAGNSTQTTLAYEKIKADILSCKLAPGQKLRINEIAGETQVSLGAVREALAKLAAEEMTVATAQKGYSVPAVSSADLIALTETRVLIEGECIACAIAGSDIETETTLVGALHRLVSIPERAPDNPNLINPAWVAAHEAFHDALVLGCTNPWLLKLRKMLYAHSERYRALSVPLARRKRDVNAEHRAIFDAVMAKDVETARHLMADHIRKTTEILLQSAAL